MRIFFVALALVASAALAAACPSPTLEGGGPLDGPIDPGGGPLNGSGRLTIVNPTGDTWDLTVDGKPRGSVGPSSEARIPSLAVGRHEVVASNDVLGLEQRDAVEVVAGVTASLSLKVLVTRLKVTNPLGVAVEIVIDGVVIGRAAPGVETVFEAVPAGRRVLVARAPTGPGAVRVEQRFMPGSESAWVVPAMADQAAPDGQRPTPPAGMGLVHMKNDSRFAVYVYADGVEKGLVAPSAWAEIVLSPGSHKLEVKIEGIEARTEHTVTLVANQVAEWIWGSEAPR